jgi:hypothetical protein
VTLVCMYMYQPAQSDQAATTAGGIPSLSAWLLGLQGRSRPCAARWTEAWAALTARLGTFKTTGDGSEKCVPGTRPGWRKHRAAACSDHDGPVTTVTQHAIPLAERCNAFGSLSSHAGGGTSLRRPRSTCLGLRTAGTSRRPRINIPRTPVYDVMVMSLVALAMIHFSVAAFKLYSVHCDVKS